MLISLPIYSRAFILDVKVASWNLVDKDFRRISDIIFTHFKPFVLLQT